MRLLRKLGRFFAVPSNNKDLALSQARAFVRQIPVLYMTIAANTVLLMTTQTEAPALLRVYLPTLLCLMCVWRAAYWWRRRASSLGSCEATIILRRVERTAGLISAAIALWALSLHGFADAHQQSHIVFYVVVTGLCSAFFLSYMHRAAVFGAMGTILPFAGFFALSGQPIFIALSLNLVLILIALTITVLANSRDFAALASSRTKLVARQALTLALTDENQRLTEVDTLTQLPNRSSFEQELTSRLALAKSGCNLVSVARVDVDSFKAVNDIFGHTIGNQVLREVARRLRAVAGANTFVARIGGDQFGLIGGISKTASSEKCGEKLCAAMRDAFVFGDVTLHLTASTGIAASRPGDTHATVFDRADYVASLAKRAARGGTILFTDEHAAEISQVRTMEHALRSANLDDELYIVFQPQFDIGLNCVTGYEVLARWRSPVLGEISPGVFIPLAERIGVIPKITQSVLRKALAIIDRVPLPQRLSVNLSAHDIGSVTAIEAIVALVERSGTPCRIDFEITETAVMGDLVQANTALLALLGLGSRIALDDFGTGHSSLTHVQKLPLDRIKIDRSFVAEITDDTTSRAIVKTTIDLCRNLGISCVFEGVETDEQLAVLRSLGGTVMQGYLFGRPMSEAQMLEHVRHNSSPWGTARNELYTAAK